ncbi:MAG: SufE family protein [Omnitrophica WOR_2 bacterium]
MNTKQTAIPTRLNEIIQDFQLAEGREKLEMLLEYAEQMPELPDWLEDHHDQMEPIPECMTPVFVQSEYEDGKMKFYFDVPRESPTVRGYAALMAEGLDGSTPEEVLQIPNDFFLGMGLQQVLTQQRLNGISAILAHMKHLAVNQLSR